MYILGAALTVEADPAHAQAWEAVLNRVMGSSAAPVGERFEASWTLQHRYHAADLPSLIALLDLPPSENDVRIGAAAILLTTLARKGSR